MTLEEKIEALAKFDFVIIELFYRHQVIDKGGYDLLEKKIREILKGENDEQNA